MKRLTLVAAMVLFLTAAPAWAAPGDQQPTYTPGGQPTFGPPGAPYVYTPDGGMAIKTPDSPFAIPLQDNAIKPDRGDRGEQYGQPENERE